MIIQAKGMITPCATDGRNIRQIPRSQGEATVRNSLSSGRFQPIAFAGQSSGSLKPLKLQPRTFIGRIFQGFADRFLLKRHGVRLDQVQVALPNGISLKRSEKRLLIATALKAYERAKINENLENDSKRYKSTSVQLENGIWGLATNVEMDRDTVFCGERSAFVVTWNKALQKLKRRLVNSEAILKARQGLKTKTLVMGTSNLGEATSICSECLDWLASQKYFSAQTLVFQLIRDRAGAFSLKGQSIGELLPGWGKQEPSISAKSVETLPVQASLRARKVLKEKTIPLERITELMSEAKKSFASSRTAEFSGKNTAAAVLFSTGLIIARARFDWTKRWFQSPDLQAASEGYQQESSRVGDKAPIRIEAIAYYGEDNKLPYGKTVGYFAQPTCGGSDTLIAVIRKDTIQLGTVLDYQPFVYVSDFARKK